MLQTMAPSTAHQYDGDVSARVGAALSELAALPGSSDVLVARMALANVVENMGTEEVAARLGMPSTTVVTVARPRPNDRVSPGSAPLLSPPKAVARRRKERRGRRDTSATVRPPEEAYFIEAGARRRAEFRTRRGERAAGRGAEAAGRHLATAPATRAPTGAWMA